uniref:Uncharacterized protein n=1 Tax=Brassica oleracea TaxID=3712 RepID=A0A3P6FP58_BRAOL|nr:unnamed protein product [Brassica oleracea]
MNNNVKDSLFKSNNQMKVTIWGGKINFFLKPPLLVLPQLFLCPRLRPYMTKSQQSLNLIGKTKNFG